MNIMEFFKLAFFAITRNKMRAFLTMLGIIVGVGSVIAMIGIGEGSKRASLELLQKMGSNMLMINSQAARGFGPQAAGTAEKLRPEDAEAMATECSNTIVAASPYVMSSRPLVWQNNNTMASVHGTNQHYEMIRGWYLEDGRFFDEAEIRAQAKVCLIGKTIVENLFPGGEYPIGQLIRVNKTPFEIIGIMEPKGAVPGSGDMDASIIAPYTTVMRKINGNDRLSTIVASTHEGKGDLAEAEVTAYLRQRMGVLPRDESPFQIFKQDDLIKASEEQAGILTNFLAIGAGISLIVGGIGITNIMLVSVTERTREIGIRRALGATQKSVMGQFLTEAVVISCIGGVAGLVLAIIAIIIIRNFMELPATAESWAMALGLGFSAVVGIIAGFLPALKAAKLNVIDSLRYE